MINGFDKTPIQRPRIAYFSPLPPTRSGIADYSSELLPYLVNHVDITLFSPEPNKIDCELREHFRIYSIEHYPGMRWQFDIPFYQMGNNAYHEAIYRMFLHYPGLVTLHDYSLYNFMAHRTIGSNQAGRYMREVGYGLGQKGIEKVRQNRLGDNVYPLHEEPFNNRLIDLSLGTVVHSNYAKNLILAQSPESPVAVIPQHMTILSEESRRHQLSWPQDAVIFASVGQITKAKQIEFALRAFKKLREQDPNVFYLLVGEEMGDVDLAAIIEELDLSDCVRHVGYVADKKEFVDWIYTADIIINLRYPTIGETSAAALRALAAGRTLILFDHGWYSELPDDICIKIPPLDETALVSVMSQLALQSQSRKQLGEYGRQYINSKHLPDNVAKVYASFIYDQLSRLSSGLAKSEFDASQ